MTALVPPGYQPVDADERGMWQMFDRLEQQIADSNLLIRDKALDDYLRDVVHRLLGDRASDMRIYAVRNTEFNASMAPNGMILVHSGLLARVRNEAQLAAVLGHECGHYLRRHSVRTWRDHKSKTALVAFASLAASSFADYTWYALANTINTTLLLSLFSFSREMEREADAYGLELMHDAGYSTRAASEVWSQLIEERKASAAARKKKYTDGSASALSTHPPTSERMGELLASALEMEGRDQTGAAADVRREQYETAIASLRASLIEEQIKLNDPGASLYLVSSLARNGWDGVLRYSEGEAYRLRDEEGDLQRAAQAYAAAVQFADAPAAAYRAHGYALLKAGKQEDSRLALARYLELQPDAPDAAIVRLSIGQ